MKKNYITPKSRAIVFRFRTSLLADSLTDKGDGLPYGGDGNNKEADSKHSIWESMDED